MISFLIPAYNEERNIGPTIESIRKYCPEAEIIVGDHRSIDLTHEIAIGNGARVITVEGGTVGHVRNELAKVAKGDILIFNDADVRLTEAWAQQIPHVLKKMPAVVGGTNQLAEGSNWIHNGWFSHLPKEKSYVITTHMVMPAAIFHKLAGFDERLSSGEDVDISERAKACVPVYNDPALHIVHVDIPQTLKSFWKREVWHGSGDFASVGHFLKSKVAIMAVAFVGLLALSVVYPPLLLLAAMIPVACSVMKAPRMSLKHRAPNAILWSAYLSARACSAFFGRSEKRLYANKM